MATEEFIGFYTDKTNPSFTSIYVPHLKQTLFLEFSPQNK